MAPAPAIVAVAAVGGIRRLAYPQPFAILSDHIYREQFYRVSAELYVSRYGLRSSARMVAEYTEGVSVAKPAGQIVLSATQNAQEKNIAMAGRVGYTWLHCGIGREQLLSAIAEVPSFRRAASQPG
jgi:hypothetical protein